MRWRQLRHKRIRQHQNGQCTLVSDLHTSPWWQRDDSWREYRRRLQVKQNSFNLSTLEPAAYNWHFSSFVKNRNSAKINNPTIEYYPPKTFGFTAKSPIYSPFLNRTLITNLFPIVIALPMPEMIFIAANNDAMLYNWKTNTESPLPPFPNRVRVTYPFTGSGILLPLSPDNGYTPEVLVCGGTNLDDRLSSSSLRVSDPASSQCARMVLTDSGRNEGWKIEQMPSPRIMPDLIMLPEGKVLIVNGAKSVSINAHNHPISPKSPHAFEHVDLEPLNRGWQGTATWLTRLEIRMRTTRASRRCYMILRRQKDNDLVRRGCRRPTFLGCIIQLRRSSPVEKSWLPEAIRTKILAQIITQLNIESNGSGPRTSMTSLDQWSRNFHWLQTIRKRLQWSLREPEKTSKCRVLKQSWWILDLVRSFSKCFGSIFRLSNWRLSVFSQ